VGVSVWSSWLGGRGLGAGAVERLGGGLGGGGGLRGGR
jgi:hypothetical protein